MDEPRPALVAAGELFGGVERHLLGMCTWLQRRGCEPLLVLFHDRELADQARALGVEPVILPTFGSFDPQAPGRLARVLADRRADLVHVHGYRATVTAALAGGRRGLPMVRTVHGLVEPSSSLTLKGMKSRIFARVEERASRRAGARVCYVTEDLRRRAGGGPGSLAVHNGIDPLAAADYGRPPEFDDGRIHVLAVGRVSAVKGLDHAVAAMAGLPADLPAVLDILGTGPLTGEIAALAAARGVAGRVRLLGFRANIYDYLAHADLLIMPSLHEGLPYTILEAMSLGLPIVASRVGGLAEILSDGVTARLVPVGDAEALGEAITALLANPDLAGSLAAAARQHQMANLDLEAMGARYWEIYRSLTGA